MSEAYIYALVNPKNDNVFYIGATSFPDNRLKQHIATRRLNNSSKNKNINDIIDSGGDVEMLIIEECEMCEANELEIFYLDLFSFYGFKLDQLRYSGFTVDINHKPIFKKRNGIKNTTYELLYMVEYKTTRLKITYPINSITDYEAESLLRIDYGKSIRGEYQPD